MKLISHRGNYNGVNPERENKPSYIDTAISMGYEVEVDIRHVEGEFYLGHDTPDTLVTLTWIEKRKNNIWFHCKNLESAKELSKIENVKYFCHSNDDYVLTSTKYLWVHNLKLPIDNTCIIPLLDEQSVKNFENKDVYAICTDHLNLFK